MGVGWLRRSLSSRVAHAQGDAIGGLVAFSVGLAATGRAGARAGGLLSMSAGRAGARAGGLRQLSGGGGWRRRRRL